MELVSFIVCETLKVPEKLSLDILGAGKSWFDMGKQTMVCVTFWTTEIGEMRSQPFVLNIVNEKGEIVDCMDGIITSPPETTHITCQPVDFSIDLPKGTYYIDALWLGNRRRVWKFLVQSGVGPTGLNLFLG